MVKDAQRRHAHRQRLSWTFTMICHHFWRVALPPAPRGTDRGRQIANPRITGGLVSHEQAKRYDGGDIGAESVDTGSKRAAMASPRESLATAGHFRHLHPLAANAT